MRQIANEVLKNAKVIRQIFYGDNVVCKSIKTCKYQRYLLDNSENAAVIDEILSSPGIKTVIAPTGSGKSTSLLNRARALVAQDNRYKVIIALPSRALTMQVGLQNGVYKMVGGDPMDDNAPIVATTYEKLFEVEDFILKLQRQHSNKRVVLLLDESHLLTTQLTFRSAAITGLIRCIENNLFYSVLLVTATPMPTSLFRCDRMIEFVSQDKRPVIDKIEIIEVDDELEYIRSLNLKQNFPFIRLNSKKRIDEMRNQMALYRIARLSAEDKKTPLYQDIVENNRIDGTLYDGVVATSAVEVGLSVNLYPDGILPVVMFPDGNFSIDDTEQFFNRIRRNGNKGVSCARVIVRKQKIKDIKVCIVDSSGEELCEFKDILLKQGNLTVNDTDVMAGIADGTYTLRFEIGNRIQYRQIKIVSEGCTDEMYNSRFSKKDIIPLLFHNVGFAELTDIVKVNYRSVQCLYEKLDKLLVAMEQARKNIQQEQVLNNDEVALMKVEDEELIEAMVKGGIAKMGELKDAISYENGKLCIDKRILFMISYNQYQRQFQYNLDILREDLAKRLNTTVVLLSENTAKGKHVKNPNNIWEGIEHLREEVLIDGEFWKALMGRKSTYMQFSKTRDIILEIREQEQIVDILKILDAKMIQGKTALQIVTASKSKAKTTQFANAYYMIIQNKLLNDRLIKLDDMDTSYLISKDQKDKLQEVIFRYLQQKGLKTYHLTDALMQEIIEEYQRVYPLATKMPTPGMVKKKLKDMYHSKGQNIIHNKVRTDINDIFKLVTSDF